MNFQKLTWPNLTSVWFEWQRWFDFVPWGIMGKWHRRNLRYTVLYVIIVTETTPWGLRAFQECHQWKLTLIIHATITPVIRRLCVRARVCVCLCVCVYSLPCHIYPVLSSFGYSFFLHFSRVLTCHHDLAFYLHNFLFLSFMFLFVR